jgi:hypothetical protein
MYLKDWRKTKQGCQAGTSKVQISMNYSKAPFRLTIWEKYRQLKRGVNLNGTFLQNCIKIEVFFEICWIEGVCWNLDRTVHTFTSI